MQMVGQNANCDGFERISFFNRTIDAPESIDLAHEHVARSVSESDGEEKSAALNICTTVSGHDCVRLSSTGVRAAIRVGTARKGAPLPTLQGPCFNPPT